MSVERDLERLLRLRRLREEAALREVERCRGEMRERLRIVDRRVAHIEQTRRERAALMGWASGDGATQVAGVSGVLRSRWALLDEDLERDQAMLIDERQELMQSEQALSAARGRWQRARLHCEAVQNLAADMQHAQRRAVDRRAEREADAPVRLGTRR